MRSKIWKEKNVGLRIIFQRDINKMYIIYDILLLWLGYSYENVISIQYLNKNFSHSLVLKKYKVFERKIYEHSFSSKWSFEIKVTSSHSSENHIKCIQHMYSYYTQENITYIYQKSRFNCLRYKRIWTACNNIH